ncbi:hypothetical protein AX16_001041 [Volvariella volvacea WC 439]|nr:hypothetical protein AX16_001041 [Volvariella volvacea WC 439]
MAEKDATARLRRAIKENNLFLVKRLIARTDMRNVDDTDERYTSLAWAAMLGHEETFEFLLGAGHDDIELSKDSRDNTVLMLLADFRPPPYDPYSASIQRNSTDMIAAALRMARMYYDRYNWILDWCNTEGKSALHLAAVRGHEELVRMLCDLGADFDLADDLGNTPLHYASAWGHIPIVQLLIERGCQYSARNNEGFTPSDYAYSYNTRDTLQEAARLQYENNKKARRQVFAQAAARGSEWGNSTPPVPIRTYDANLRTRSGSGTSSTTATSDSGEVDYNGLATGPRSQSSLSASSSPSQPSAGSGSLFLSHQSRHTPNTAPSSNAASQSVASSSSQLGVIPPASALSPIANRMKERDLDAMEKYRRNRSGSGNSTMDSRIHNTSMFSVVTATPTEDVKGLKGLPIGSGTLNRRLRPSMSAAQLRTTPEPPLAASNSGQESRSRSGTNPLTSRPSLSPSPLLIRSSSTSTPMNILPSNDGSVREEPENYTGPPSQYARFPEPPMVIDDVSTPTSSTISSRRKAFHLLSKPFPGVDSSAASHRRGMSATSVRGA